MKRRKEERVIVPTDADSKPKEPGPSDTANGGLLFSQAIDLYIAGRKGLLSPRTLDMYRGTLRRVCRFIGDMGIDQVTVHHLRIFRSAEFDRDLSLHTIAKTCREIKTFFYWLYEEEIIDKNPARRFELPHLPDNDPKAARVEDIERVLSHLSHCEKWGIEPQALICRERAVLLFLCDCGGRVGGLTSLTMDRLDLANREAVVIEKGRGGGKRRVVYFGERTEAALRDWLRYRPRPLDPEDDRVFLNVRDATLHGGKSKRGSAMTGGQVNHRLRKWAKRAGVNGRFNPHSFRHLAARQWLENGGNLASVSQLLGHSGIEVTASYYARWSRNELKKIHDQVSWL